MSTLEKNLLTANKSTVYIRNSVNRISRKIILLLTISTLTFICQQCKRNTPNCFQYQKIVTSSHTYTHAHARLSQTNCALIEIVQTIMFFVISENRFKIKQFSTHTFSYSIVRIQYDL